VTARRRKITNLAVPRGVPVTPQPRAPRSWELAAKSSVPSDTLVRHRHDLTGRFFLGLALGFNDLKGLTLFEQYLEAMGRPSAGDYSPYFGQWHGTNVQIHRWIVGVLHELMLVIDAKQYKPVLKSVELARFVAAIDPKHQEAWKLLVSVASAPVKQAGLPAVLHRIRNDAAFHYNYNGTSLGEAYIDLFGSVAASNPNGANAGAQFSYGGTLPAVRFYFADGAAQHVMTKLLLANQATIDDIFEFAKKAMLSIAELLRVFIQSRQPA